MDSVIARDLPVTAGADRRPRFFWVGTIAGVLLGAVFLIAVWSKALDPSAFAEQIQANPRNYMAQPMLTLSTVPTITGNRVAPRHVDLRPFILSGSRIDVTAGGLTRVALVEGSMVVNSSQGGGSKDTWVVDLGRRSA